MKVIRFFAVNDDIKEVLSEVETIMDLQYITAKGYPNTTVERYISGLEIPDIGYATHESASSSQPFLVAARDLIVKPRQVALNAGGSAISFDELLNQDAVTFTPSGRWGSDIVLYGTIGTAHGTEASMKIIKTFEQVFKKRFKKIKAFWVGPKALEELHDGKRLTIAAQSPKDFDLTQT